MVLHLSGKGGKARGHGAGRRVVLTERRERRDVEGTRGEMGTGGKRGGGRERGRGSESGSRR